MHRIGRTGRAEQQGQSILFYTEKEAADKEIIETLMDYKIPLKDFPADVEISKELIPEERSKDIVIKHKKQPVASGGAFHEKLEKNTKTNQGGSYLRKKKRHKNPRTKGDKFQNLRKKGR